MKKKKEGKDEDGGGEGDRGREGHTLFFNHDAKQIHQYIATVYAEAQILYLCACK
jgi:hypothetical protein